MSRSPIHALTIGAPASACTVFSMLWAARQASGSSDDQRDDRRYDPESDATSLRGGGQVRRRAREQEHDAGGNGDRREVRQEQEAGPGRVVEPLELEADADGRERRDQRGHGDRDAGQRVGPCPPHRYVHLQAPAASATPRSNRPGAVRASSEGVITSGSGTSSDTP